MTTVFSKQQRGQILVARDKQWSGWIVPSKRMYWPYIERIDTCPNRPHVQHRIVCCDCGLAHDMEFILVDTRGTVITLPQSTHFMYRVRRNERSTARIRHTYPNRGQMALLANRGSDK